jgi:hypothetical protein
MKRLKTYRTIHEARVGIGSELRATPFAAEESTNVRCLHFFDVTASDTRIEAQLIADHRLSPVRITASEVDAELGGPAAVTTLDFVPRMARKTGFAATRHYGGVLRLPSGDEGIRPATHIDWLAQIALEDLAVLDVATQMIIIGAQGWTKDD